MTHTVFLDPSFRARLGASVSVYEPDKKTTAYVLSILRAKQRPELRRIISCRQLRADVAQDCQDMLGYVPRLNPVTFALDFEREEDVVWWTVYRSGLSLDDA